MVEVAEKIIKVDSALAAEKEKDEKKLSNSPFKGAQQL